VTRAEEFKLDVGLPVCCMPELVSIPVKGRLIVGERIELLVFELPRVIKLVLVLNGMGVHAPGDILGVNIELDGMID
jgi:hypothetical protein